MEFVLKNFSGKVGREVAAEEVNIEKLEVFGRNLRYLVFMGELWFPK